MHNPINIFHPFSWVFIPHLNVSEKFLFKYCLYKVHALVLSYLHKTLLFLLSVMVRLLPVKSASHADPSCCTCDPVSFYCNWENSRGWSKCLGPSTHMGDLDEAPNFWLWPDCCLVQLWPLQQFID